MVAPPSKFHRYVSGVLLSGSLPVPSKVTAPFTRTVVLLVGRSMVLSGASVTVMRTVSGDRSAKPRASVTVKVTSYTPGELKATSPGSSTVLLVAPPSKFHKKVSGVLLSGSEASALKFTEVPVSISRSVAGAVMVPSGRSVTVTCTVAGVGSAMPSASVTVNVTV